MTLICPEFLSVSFLNPFDTKRSPGEKQQYVLREEEERQLWKKTRTKTQDTFMITLTYADISAIFSPQTFAVW